MMATVAACGAPASETADQASPDYDVRYDVTLRPESGTADIRLRVSQPRHLLRQLRFDTRSIGDLDGDGDVSIDNGRAVWTVPASGGELRWSVKLENRRSDAGYDALLTPGWGIFRAEDLIPRAAARGLRGAASQTRLRLHMPANWSAVTEYPTDNNDFVVNRPGRRFAQPAGWIAVGDLGVRRERIAGVRVAIAGPVGHSVRRLDMLALFNWNLPELARIVPGLSGRLTVVSAGDPMWRGGLSAPQSIFLHAERPLISENGTSTLLHEAVHMATGLQAKTGYDWIVEGIAEYYSLELMKRSGTLTPARFEEALAFQRRWAEQADNLCGERSSGPTTAAAVMHMVALDEEIASASEGAAGLDDVLRELLENRDIDLSALVTAATAVLGHKPDALHIDRLSGCRSIGGEP